EEACTNAVILKSFNQQIHPSHLFMLANDDLEKSVHEVVPNYLRRTEADTKWMEKQEQRQNAQQQLDGKQYQDSQRYSDSKQHRASQQNQNPKQHQDSQQNLNSQHHQHPTEQPNHHKNGDSVHG